MKNRRAIRNFKKELASYVLENSFVGNRKKEEKEKAVVFSFLQRIIGEARPTSKIVKREKPDFKIIYNSDIFGLEMTEFFHEPKRAGSKIFKVFQAWKSISHNLRNELKNRNLDHWYAALHFKETHQWKIMPKPFANELISFAINNLPQCKLKSFKIYRFDNFALLNEYLNHIYFLNTDPIKGCLWWHASLRSGEILGSVDEVFKIIEKKNKKALGYTWPSDERILLIFARGANLAEVAILEENEIQQLGASLRSFGKINFSHIYIWSKFPADTVWEVWPLQQKIFYNDGKSWILRVNKVPLLNK